MKKNAGKINIKDGKETKEVKKYVKEMIDRPLHSSKNADLLSLHTLDETDDLLDRIDDIQKSSKQTDTHFEIIFNAYLVTHLLIQYFNIYRLNFHNYNFYLLFLTVIILYKRILIKYFQSIKRENPLELSSPHMLMNLFVIVFLVLNSIYLVIQLFLRHPLNNFMFLLYPVILWLLVFGFSRKGSYHSKSAKITHKFRHLLYNTFECGYYAGFLPLRFLQHEYLYFDTMRCIFLIIFLFANSFTMLCTHLLSTNFYDLYLYGKHFGKWKPVEKGTASTPTWNEADAPYTKGSLVEWNGKYYMTEENCNTAEPGNMVHVMFSLLFSDPNRTHSIQKMSSFHMLVIGLQVIIVISQFFVYIYSNHWNIDGISLLFSYYNLYMCINTKRSFISIN